ncbi:helix-turn-helix domain-containing protein [Enterococcus casseliflavus]|nr:helix-turn-helix domain-containing protein [Enterococcus casseliflavus]
MKDLQLKFIVDPTTIRWFRILNLFERTQKATKGQLAKLNEVSERTILTDINKLKEYFSDSAQIVSTNNGYLFEKKNSLRFIEQKEKLLQNEILFELLGNVFYGELEDVAELIDRFHISETSFRRYLRQIEPVLKEYGLKLSLTPIDLKGDEANIRKFFKDFYYEGEMTPHTLVPPKEIHELIYQTFLSKIKEITIGTGTSPNEFYYNLYIAIERVRQGKRINVPTNLYKSVRNNKDFLNLFLIQQRIQKIYQVELCADELCWLFLVTIAKRPFDQIDQDKVFCKQLQRIDSFAHLTENYL